MPPVDFEQKKQYPLVLLIHGGPHNMFGHDFDERAHLLSQSGYAVLYINPRGSHGYGQAFSNGTLMNWGGGDYQDLMTGTDFALKENPWLDENRIWQWSPLRNVARTTTPTLLLHGETDNEVPFSQAEEMFIALKKRGVDTRLVQYKGEGHGWRPELKPRNKADLNKRMIQWFDTYLKTTGPLSGQVLK
jgi:dipeptidyl aminopeptidase/acylaminoacyl peptidase